MQKRKMLGWLYAFFIIALILFAIICPFTVTDVPPEYLGTYGGDVYDVEINDHPLPEDFITVEMQNDIEKVKSTHAKNGIIDKKTALEIAKVAIKHYERKDFFTQRTNYVMSHRADIDAYFVSIWPVHEPGVLSSMTERNLIISKKDGTVLSYWIQ